MSPIAVSNNFLVAPAAYDAAVRYNPRERWLLRDEQQRFDALRLLCQVPAITELAQLPTPLGKLTIR
jgi:hypothetical protein